MSTFDICVPAEQEGTRSQVLRWLKQPGDAVRQHEPLVELETDKVTVEVPAPADGVLREILKGEREELEPGEVLGRMETGAATGGESASAESSAIPFASGHDQNAATAVDSTKVATGLTTAAGNAARQLSPAVKRLLAEHSLDPSNVRGTGQGGRITVEDVLAHIASAQGGAAAQASGERVSHAPSSHAPSSRPAALSSGRLVPHSTTRQRVAEHMVESLLHTAPHVTSVFEADLGKVIAHRERHRADFEQRGVPLTFTTYFLKACVAAIRAVPEANSRWTDTALEIFDHMDIGIATALEEGGLVVPVLRNVEALDLFGIAAGLNDLTSRARSGGLKPADMRGGTFTISNHGVSGSLLATPIVINQPQSAILGVGKLERRPVALDDDRIVVRPRCYVTLTIDHRVMDGLQANRFLAAFVDALGVT